MELVSPESHIPDDEPKVRVYDNYVVLNAAAVSLLGIDDGDYVQLWTSKHEKMNGKHFIYIGRTRRIFGYAVRQRAKTMRINSRPLARRLMEVLDGCGCYRICPEDTQVVDGEIRYNIFFKNYDKKDTD